MTQTKPGDPGDGRQDYDTAKAAAKEVFMGGTKPLPENESLEALFEANTSNPPPMVKDVEPHLPREVKVKPKKEPAPEAEPEAPANEDEMKAARLEALRSPVLTPEMVDSLSPADLLSVAAKAKEDRAERDRIARAVADQKASGSEKEASTPTAVPVASPSIDLGELASPFLDSIGYSEDAAAQKGLTDLVSKAVQAAVEPLKAELAAERAEREGGEANSEGRRAIEIVRQELSGTHPELADNAVYAAKIEPQVTKLLSTGEYGSHNVTQLVKDAYLLGLGRNPRAPVTDNRKRNKTRELAQPTPIRNGREAPIPTTAKERAYAQFNRMLG